MDIETIRNTEIAARLDRAIQSSLPASSSSSSSTPSSPSTSPSLKLEAEAGISTSLSDLVLLLNADPEDRFSQICLAYAASPLHQRKRSLHPPPSFTSSLAYQHLVESLHIDGLEPDLQEAEAQQQPPEEREEYSSHKETSKPISTGGESKPLSQSDAVYTNPNSLNLDQKPEFNEISTSLIQANISSTSEVDAIPSVKSDNFTVKTDKNHPSILDYTSKLEGISLDDFFSNQVRPQDKDSRKPDTISDNRGKSIKNTSIISIQKDSFFLDPLTESIIPDGSELFSYTSGSDMFLNVSDRALESTLETIEDDDPFSSWEGEFQSAKADITNTSLFESQLHTPDMFGTNPKRAEPEISDDDWGNGWVGSSLKVNGDTADPHRDNPDVISLFPGDGLANGSQVVTENTPTSLSSSIHLHTEDLSTLSFFSSTSQTQPVSQGNIDVDSLVLDSASLPNNSPSTSGFKSEFTGSGLQPNGDNLFHFPAMAVNVSYGGDLQIDTARSGEKSENAVGALLAQLHDLSFMLSDTLFIKEEEDRKQ